MKAKLIKTDGTVTEVEPENGTDFQLEELRKFVGGHIEVVYPPSRTGAIMVVNEEGRLLHLPVNYLATTTYNHDLIVGDALLCHRSQLK